MQHDGVDRFGEMVVDAHQIAFLQPLHVAVRAQPGRTADNRKNAQV